MTKKNVALKKILIVSLAAFLFVACSKQGPQGIRGPAGPAGAVGPAGKDGAMFLTGDGVPNAQTGKTGDYYLDKKTSNLYGPKSDKGWGDPFTLAGSEGGLILSGSGMPGTSLGTSGDYYLDTASYLLYGPKLNNNSWGPGLALKGTGGNSGIREYMISNPYHYTAINPDDLSYYLNIGYDTNNGFDLYNDVTKQHDMIAVYIIRNQTIWKGGDSVGIRHEIYLANSGVNTLGMWEGAHFQISSFIADNGLQVIPYNPKFTHNDDFKSVVAFSAILVFVIPSSAVSNITPPTVERISNPAKSKAIQQLLKPYLTR